MARGSDDLYMKNFSREINYLKSILNSLKPKELHSNSNWSEIVKEQQKVLNTLQGDFAIKMTDLEQRLKQNTIRIFKIPEKPNENTMVIVRDFFSEKLKLVVTPEDIECCRRSGKANGGWPRAIVVKFTSDDVRKRVMKRRNTFGKHNIYQELCAERYKIKQEAISRFGKNNVSVVDGIVEIKVPGYKDRCERFFTMVQFKNFLQEKSIEQKTE